MNTSSEVNDSTRMAHSLLLEAFTTGYVKRLVEGQQCRLERGISPIMTHDPRPKKRGINLGRREAGRSRILRGAGFEGRVFRRDLPETTGYQRFCTQKNGVEDPRRSSR